MCPAGNALLACKPLQTLQPQSGQASTQLAWQQVGGLWCWWWLYLVRLQLPSKGQPDLCRNGLCAFVCFPSCPSCVRIGIGVSGALSAPARGQTTSNRLLAVRLCSIASMHCFSGATTAGCVCCYCNQVLRPCPPTPWLGRVASTSAWVTSPRPRAA